jgi:hypothetical protein
MGTVEPGREDEFVAAWRAMADGAMAEFHPPERPHLLRDRERRNLFRSFGYWEDEKTVKRFRVFIQPHLTQIRELVEELEFFTLDEIPVDA